MEKRFVFLVSVLIGCNCYADDLDVAMINVRDKCSGISAQLSELKKMAGINTAITGVGTATATGATVVGIVKSSVDKDLRKILAALDNNDNTTKNPVSSDVFSVYDKSIEKYGGFENARKTLTEKSKKLGNWRTGLLGAGAATNVAGAIIASKNKIDQDLQTQIDECIKSVDSLTDAIGQARLDGVDTNIAQEIVHECGEYKYADLSVVNKRARGAMISSIVGATTGTVGTITSAVANTDKVRNGDETKEKGLNTASNVLAGGTAVASGVATVFNATQIAAVKRIVAIAEKCEKALQ